MLKMTIMFVGILGLSSSLAGTEQLPAASKPPFAYRSASVCTDSICSPKLIEEFAKVGSNDVCFQIQLKEQSADYANFRKRLIDSGSLKAIRDKEMTISVWTHEFCFPDAAWGEITMSNPRLWQGVADRYERYMTKALPEADYWVLTTSETTVSPRGPGKGPDMFPKLVNVIADKCRKHGKKLIVRSHAHAPNAWAEWEEALKKFPADVIVQTKDVPQDWHLRSINDPLIGTAVARGHAEVVEFDTAGEYFRLLKVVNCCTDILEPRFENLLAKGVTGVSIRIDRYGADVFDHPQQVNYWYLALRASGQAQTQEQVWERWTKEYYGAKAAPTMIKALRPTGQVMAEALCIAHDTFGNTRTDKVGGFGGKNPKHPLERTLDWPWAPAGYAAVADPNTPLLKEHALAKAGDPSIIAREEEGYQKQLASADESIRLVNSIKDKLDPGCYEMHRWLLEENRFHLIVMEEMQLAWLKALRLRNTQDAAEKARLTAEIEQHIKNLEAKLPEMEQKKEINWRGRKQTLGRGSYVDVKWFLEVYPSFLKGEPPPAGASKQGK